MKVLAFDDVDLAPREVEVTIRSEKYVIRELSLGQAITYRNASVACAKMRDGKVIGMEGIADLESLLLSLCLWKVGEKNGERILMKVTRGFIEELPGRVASQLHAQAKEISELNEKIGADDPTTDLITLCKRDLSEQYHPDKGGKNEDIMKGVNLALEWLDSHRRQKPEDSAKNGRASTASISS
jgi:hypothetical protein